MPWGKTLKQVLSSWIDEPAGARVRNIGLLSNFYTHFSWFCFVYKSIRIIINARNIRLEHPRLSLTCVLFFKHNCFSRVQVNRELGSHHPSAPLTVGLTTRTPRVTDQLRCSSTLFSTLHHSLRNKCAPNDISRRMRVDCSLREKRIWVDDGGA